MQQAIGKTGGLRNKWKVIRSISTIVHLCCPGAAGGAIFYVLIYFSDSAAPHRILRRNNELEMVTDLWEQSFVRGTGTHAQCPMHGKGTDFRSHDFVFSRGLLLSPCRYSVQCRMAVLCSCVIQYVWCLCIPVDIIVEGYFNPRSCSRRVFKPGEILLKIFCSVLGSNHPV